MSHLPHFVSPANDPAPFKPLLCRYYHFPTSRPNLELRTSACPQYESNACCAASTVVSGTHLNTVYENFEIQTVSVIATSGDFTLTFDTTNADPLVAVKLAATTGAITAPASASDVQTALIGLGNIQTSAISVALTIVDEVQTVSITATSGTFTLTYAGQTTSALTAPATAAAVQAALLALSNIGAKSVTVTLGTSTIDVMNYVVTFTGADVSGNIAEMTITDISLASTGIAKATSVSTTTQGETYQYAITFKGDDVRGNVPRLQITNTNLVSTGSAVMVSVATTTADHSYRWDRCAQPEVYPKISTIKRTASAVATNELIFATAHGFPAGAGATSRVVYSDGGAASGITGLTSGKSYYVIAASTITDGTALKLALTNNGAAIAITGGAAGNFIASPYTTMSAACNAYFVAEACVYECDPEAGMFRKFAPPSIYDPSAHHSEYTGQSGANEWQMHGMPIALEYADQYYEACKHDYWTTGAGGDMWGVGNVFGIPEVQTVTVTATGGTYTLSYVGQITSAISFDASASDVAAKLTALSNIGSNSVEVDKVGSVYTVAFTGTDVDGDVAAMISASVDLVAATGSASVVVATTTAGDKGGCATFEDLFGNGEHTIEKIWGDAFVVVGKNASHTIADKSGSADDGYAMWFHGDSPNSAITNERYGRLGASATPPVAGSVVELHGAGTTNPSKFLWNAMDLFETRSKVPLSMTYRAVGSSTGMKEMVGGVPVGSGGAALNHFGAGDIPMSNTYWAAAVAKGRKIMHLPFAVGAIAIFYSPPAGVSAAASAIKLDVCTLAKIFSHTITTWNDAAITALNPGFAGSGAINVVHRILGSSSTTGFTEYLAAACPASWTLGSGSTITWPSTTVGAQGSAGVSAVITATAGSIGYIDAGHGHAAGLKEISLANQAGVSVTSKTASLSDTVATALSAAPSIIPTDPAADWSGVSLYNLGGSTAWPITMLSYFYIEADFANKYPAGAAGKAHPPMSAALLRAFLEWTLSAEGQTSLEAFAFAKLPATMVTYNTATLNAVKWPTVGYRPFSFELASTTLVGTGAGRTVISGKVQSYADYDREQLRKEQLASTTVLTAEIAATTTKMETAENVAGGIAIAGFVLVLLLCGLVGVSLFAACIGISIGINAKKKADARGKSVPSIEMTGVGEME